MLAQRTVLIEQLRELPGEAGLDVLASWRSALPDAPTPLRLLDNVAQLLRPERFDTQYLTLHATPAEEGL